MKKAKAGLNCMSLNESGFPMVVQSIRSKTSNKEAKQYLSLTKLRGAFNAVVHGDEEAALDLAKRSCEVMIEALQNEKSKSDIKDLLGSDDWIENQNNTLGLLDYLIQKKDSDMAKMLAIDLALQASVVADDQQSRVVLEKADGFIGGFMRSKTNVTAVTDESLRSLFMTDIEKNEDLELSEASLPYIKEHIYSEKIYEFQKNYALKELDFEIKEAEDGNETFLFCIAKKAVQAVFWKSEQVSSEEDLKKLTCSDEWFKHCGNTLNVLDDLIEEHKSPRAKLLLVAMLSCAAVKGFNLRDENNEECYKGQRYIEANDATINLINELNKKHCLKNSDKELLSQAKTFNKMVNPTAKLVIEREEGLIKSNKFTLH